MKEIFGRIPVSIVPLFEGQVSDGGLMHPTQRTNITNASAKKIAYFKLTTLIRLRGGSGLVLCDQAAAGPTAMIELSYLLHDSYESDVWSHRKLVCNSYCIAC